jgi:hypothetical protein
VISYQMLYPGGTNTATWRLASDMYDRARPGGHSVHGDWFNGWQPDIMQTWTRLCVQQPATTCGSHMLGDGRVMV